MRMVSEYTQQKTVHTTGTQIFDAKSTPIERRKIIQKRPGFLIGEQTQKFTKEMGLILQTIRFTPQK